MKNWLDRVSGAGLKHLLGKCQVTLGEVAERKKVKERSRRRVRKSVKDREAETQGEPTKPPGWGNAESEKRARLECVHPGLKALHDAYKQDENVAVSESAETVLDAMRITGPLTPNKASSFVTCANCGTWQHIDKIKSGSIWDSDYRGEVSM